MKIEEIAKQYKLLNKFPLDLQLFADSEGGQGGEGSAGTGEGAEGGNNSGGQSGI